MGKRGGFGFVFHPRYPRYPRFTISGFGRRRDSPTGKSAVRGEVELGRKKEE